METLLSVDLLWLVLVIFTVCFVFILALKGNDRFWLPCMIMWLFLFFSVILTNAFTASDISYLEMQESQQPTLNKEGEVIPSFEIEQAKKNREKSTGKLINLLGCHTIFCFVWMLLGYRQTTLKYYKTAAISFALISIIYIVYVIATF